MEQLINKGLKKLGIKSSLQTVHSISGGDINESYYVRTTDEQFFLKVNRQASLDFFQFEADGLSIIQKTNTIDVPKVFGCFEVDGVPMLWLEWIEGRENVNTSSLLGQRLAMLHRVKVENYGYNNTSYIGRLKQEHALMDHWDTYFRDIRLLSQIRIGKTLGRITGKREHQLERLLDHLEKWIPSTPQSSILHGDLWGGNWMIGKGGTPYLIDPAILYGDHEFEIAFTELFGGFSQNFYEAYQATYPLSDTYQERKELYQLYYLLVHLNLFGESYGSSIDRILNYYIG